jgi:hypothetical protein
VIGGARRPSSIDSHQRTREKLRQQLREGRLDARLVEIEVREKNFPSFEIYTNQGIEEMDINIKDMMPGLFGSRSKTAPDAGRRGDGVSAPGGGAEAGRLWIRWRGSPSTGWRVRGIIFLDEIDKIAGREGGHGPEVSAKACSATFCRSSRARPSTPSTGWSEPTTSCFIAAGAFHVSKPSDLIPELQGRFPIRVELQPLTIDDFKRILTGAEERADQAVPGDDGDGRNHARVLPTMRSTSWRVLPFRSTRRPRISGRGGCRRSSRRYSTRSLSRDRIWSRRRQVIDAAYVEPDARGDREE